MATPSEVHHRERERGRRQVLVWLLAVYLMIFAMVVIGGITRLTSSGLSMVQWHPLMGALPPLDDAGYQEAFDKYKQFPQYQSVNHWMTLADFKRIFFWEYVHRLFGRLIGIVFIVPWLVLVVRRRLRGRLALRCAAAFVLGGLQGLLGWYMVKSGLVDVPAVSHFRLAAHLALAFFVACWVLWIILDLLRERSDTAPEQPLEEPARRRLIVAAWALVALISLQIVYGAFMAGTRAGYLYADFPKMAGRWLPSQAFAYDSLSYNLLSNPYGIHFIHRSLAWLVLVAVIAFVVVLRRQGGEHRRRAAHLLLAITTVQLLLGALTVMLHVPIAAATAHQGAGLLLLSAAVYAVHSLARGRAPTKRAI